LNKDKAILPLKKGKTNTKIQETEISYEVDWQKQHLRAITSAYRSAPFFDHYSDKILDIISTDWKFLYRLNAAVMDLVSGLQLIDTYSISDTFLSSDAYMLDKRPMNSSWVKKFPAYNQVFESKFGFVNNLSIIDAIFNLGPETRFILRH